MARNFEIQYDPATFIPPASAHADRGVVQNRTYVAFDANIVEAMYSPAADEYVLRIDANNALTTLHVFTLS